MNSKIFHVSPLVTVQNTDQRLVGSAETNSKFYYSNSWYQNDRIFD